MLNVSLDLDSEGAFLNPSRKLCLKTDNTIYFAQTGCEYFARYKEFVEINGKRYWESSPSKIVTSDCSIISLSSFPKRIVFYKGDFYFLHSFQSISNQKEMYEACYYLSELDKTSDIIDYGEDNFSRVTFIEGLNTNIYRDITLSELQMSYKDLLKKSNKFDKENEKSMDRFLNSSEDAMNIFIKDVCQILCITESSYKSGRYNLNDQMIKRLHRKIQYKSKNRY
jgi:hypothetical protein